METLSITIREPAANVTPLDKTAAGAEPTVTDLLTMLGLPPATIEAIMARYPAHSLPAATLTELIQVPTIGRKYGARIYAALRLPGLLAVTAQTFLSPADIWAQLSDLREAKKEYFVIFYLDTRNQEIKRDIVSVGTLNYNLVHPREVFHPAVLNLAAAVIVAHNHPSGSLEPSDEDLSLTRRLVQAGKLLGIEVLDHVLVTKDGWMSFKQKNLMK